MRLFEILIIIFLGLILFNAYVLKKHRLKRLLPAITILWCILHVLVEGYRSQMLPAFILLGLLLIQAYFCKGTLISSKKLKVIGRIGCVFLFIIACLLPLLMPIFKMPPPTGPYAVGTRLMQFTDYERAETFTDDPDDYRELSVQVWYPAEHVDGYDKAKYYGNKKIPEYYLKTMPIPALIGFKHLTYVNTNSYSDVPLCSVKGQYPVIIFSHAYLGNVGQNTIQMEELASHGYIIFSIGHPYDAVGVEFMNGRFVGFDKNQRDSVFEEMETYMNKKTLKAYGIKSVAIQLTNHAKILPKILERWADDTMFIADELKKIHDGEVVSIFNNRLDLERLGIFGHSVGGATAGLTLLLDNRFKAGINLDGGQFGGHLKENILSQPFMVMQSSATDGAVMDGYHQEQKNIYSITVSDSSHTNYTDISISAPLYRYIGLNGKIKGSRIENIINDYVLSFFDKYLKDENAPLLEDSQHIKYKEVTIEYK